MADCVCLMSLDKHEAVPVDTHLWQITTKHYMPHLVKTKTLTDKVYKQIGKCMVCTIFAMSPFNWFVKGP